ncbi:nuclear migration protein nudF [Penicillium angulare]|uniref:nuclear migration protein nudF n=1 Tax=Penicillium angulare TaxID=116970 RepID=UPI002541F959|nr:nuclear migration protein nudF [Penicillium angulare]KAJ5263931.1 nuclear migration protein nudF [Penicillium angulare]
MTCILTSKQAGELHKSMIAYLSSVNAIQSVAVLEKELPVDITFNDVARKKYEGLLARKWTNVMRLQRRILDLESRVSNLESKLENVAPVGVGGTPKSCLPDMHATHTLQSHRAAISCIAFHPVHPSIASASDDFSIKIWNREVGTLEYTLNGHLRPVLGLDFGRPQRRTLLASCSNDLTIKIWDPNNCYSNVRTLYGHDDSVSAVRFLTTTGTLLVSASRDASIRIWDALTGYCVRSIHTEGNWIRDISPSFDGACLVVGGNDRTATVWETSSGQPKATLSGHESYIECCTFAPASSHLYLGGLIPTAVLGVSLRGSSFIATGSRDKSIKIWNDTGILIKTLVGHEGWVRGLAFHPSGRYLASVGDDRTIRIWDLLQDGQLVNTFDGFSDHFITCVRWGPKQINQDLDISYVLGTGGADSSVRIWL